MKAHPKAIAILWFLLLAITVKATATTYYVSTTHPARSDQNAGTDVSAPWATLSEVSNRNFNPGDSVLFERGSFWREMLVVPSSGTLNNPIYFGAYGTGQKPVFTGSEAFTGWSSFSGSVYSVAVPKNPGLC